MSSPLVSAIIIFKDGLPFLEDSIESVLTQSYTPLELILVDDGSVDGSETVAATYARRNPEFTTVVCHPKKENKGMSATRNLGVEHSRGEYLAFLDADDVWLPEKTAEQVQIMQAHPDIGLLYGKTQIWHSWTSEPGTPKDFFYDLGVETGRTYNPPELLAILIENKYQTPTTCNAMIRRETYEELGGFEDAFRGLYEDQVFFSKLYMTWPTYVSENYWARYRQHPGNANPKFSRIEYLRQRRAFLRFVYKYAEQHRSMLDERTQKALTRQLWQSNHPYIDFLNKKIAKWREQVILSNLLL